MMARMNRAKAATLAAVTKKAVIGVGEPSYTSGVHMWNGTAPNLEREPSDQEHNAEDQSDVETAGCRTTVAIAANSVVPVKP